MLQNTTIGKHKCKGIGYYLPYNGLFKKTVSWTVHMLVDFHGSYMLLKVWIYICNLKYLPLQKHLPSQLLPLCCCCCFPLIWFSSEVFRTKKNNRLKIQSLKCRETKRKKLSQVKCDRSTGRPIDQLTNRGTYKIVWVPLIISVQISMRQASSFIILRKASVLKMVDTSGHNLDKK